MEVQFITRNSDKINTWNSWRFCRRMCQLSHSYIFGNKIAFNHILTYTIFPMQSLFQFSIFSFYCRLCQYPKIYNYFFELPIWMSQFVIQFWIFSCSCCCCCFFFFWFWIISFECVELKQGLSIVPCSLKNKFKNTNS